MQNFVIPQRNQEPIIIEQANLEMRNSAPEPGKIEEICAILPPNGIKRLFTDFSNRNEDDPLVINCDYYDTTTRIPNQNEKKFSMFHMNIASLGLHKDELVTALSLLKVKFDIITLSETKIIKGTKPTYDITLPGYKEYSTPTESSKGGVIIYVKEEIEIKRRIDLESTMYEAGKLETVFLEILNEKKKNVIIGV